ncbi:MAG TPA: TetR family transcriptional regulator C-terminal domain-containing protein [Acidimicrobiales bacterium]|nr:TetR family transcriptional regulator C-terminal domain-containing protein [Acidimicrobiales bacterium]
MAEGATAVASDVRREQMLRAALEVIVERGFPETRIADVAERAGVSPALVIYYFKTKDALLGDAMRYAEDRWYEDGARRLQAIPTAAGRLTELVSMSCIASADHDVQDSWSLWLDLWAQSVRHPAVAEVRAEFDEHWRRTIREIVTEGEETGEFYPVDVDEFAVMFCSLLDGLAIQIAVGDPVVDAQRAFDVAMSAASRLLGFELPRAGATQNRRKAGGARVRG